MSLCRIPLLLVLLSLAFSPGRSPGPPPPAPARTDRYGDPLPPGAIARLGSIRWRVDGEQTSVRYAPDGKTLLVVTGRENASDGHLLHRLNTADGKALGRLPAPL